MSAMTETMSTRDLRQELDSYYGRQDLTAADVERATAVVSELNYRENLWYERFGRGLAESNWTER